MKRAWLRVLPPVVLLAGVTTAQAEGNGSTLWRTQDQRGEAALRAGDPAAAARTYTDPRRKAYAELKAGDYLAAARRYEALDDAEAPYNLGNALARAGALRQALQAYDVALARDPGDRHARRNRDLVAQAMQQQPAQGAQGQNPSPFAGGPGGRQPPMAVSAPSTQVPPGPGSERHGREPSAAPGARDTRGRPPASTRSAGADRADNAEQAQRDAANARQQIAAAASAAAGGEQAGPRERREPAPASRTEQQLAEDQWLRRLPDDPSGLLRRKFLIQYQMRLGVSP